MRPQFILLAGQCVFVFVFANISPNNCIYVHNCPSLINLNEFVFVFVFLKKGI